MSKISEGYSPIGKAPLIALDTFSAINYHGVKIHPGRVLPFGATALASDIVNFSIYSRNATSCSLALFHKGEAEPYIIIPFRSEGEYNYDFQFGYVFSMIVYELDFENTEYGYIFDGANDGFNRFDATQILLDPYAKAISGRDRWGKLPPGGKPAPFRSRIQRDDFPWNWDRQLDIPMEDLIIYEMHVRGFTAHPSSGVKYPGTFAALREKIPYLKKLGVNCVELLPIFEFDEFEHGYFQEAEEVKVRNYWGYSTVGFFAPKAGYAATGWLGTQADELKTLVRDLHKNGIEVILDVVFNHTAEGTEAGPWLSFRGIDNQTYYMLTPDGSYRNYSGCGNTLNCNDPVVRNMILDCLRYWASEYHIDGFRFDLASILGRSNTNNDQPMENPPLLEALAFDPILGRSKLIAEAWDAGGLYQVGNFTRQTKWSTRWSEWNGRFRDSVRKFLIGEPGQGWLVAKGMEGSIDMYNPATRGFTASVNFITAHDGFTMMDLFSYNKKNNLANGENNRDGSNDNNSWDCREPGLSDKEVKKLRKKMVKNAMSILLLSHGVPMILAGDEFGNSQKGNNNPYCQDNEISWLNWKDLKKNQDIFDYVAALIHLRKQYSALRSPKVAKERTKYGYPPVSYHGKKSWYADFSGSILGMLFAGDNHFVYVGLNMCKTSCELELPALPDEFTWELVLATDERALFDHSNHIHIHSRSTMILLGRKRKS